MCAGVECIAYQIADVVNAMSQDDKNRDSGAASGRWSDQKSVSDAVPERYPESKGACAGCRRARPGLELLMQPEEDWGCMEMKCLRV